ncbi:hypothetical protein ACSVC9_09250 [Clostridium sp. LBM24168]
MGTTNTCKYGIASDGMDLVVLNKEFKREKDIPSFDGSMLPSSMGNYSYMVVSEFLLPTFFRYIVIICQV